MNWKITLSLGVATSFICACVLGEGAQNISPEQIPTRTPSNESSQARRGQMMEWRINADVTCKNPYDPDEVSIEAIIKTPSGRELLVPGFYAEPCAKTSESPAARLNDIAVFRFFLPADRWVQGDKVTFYVDDIELVNSHTGQKILLYDFEQDTEWKTAKTVTPSFATDTVHGGKRSLALNYTVIDKDIDRWPGANSVPTVRNWSQFDTLTFWIFPKNDAKTGIIGVEFYNAAKEKFQTHYIIGKGEALEFGRWNQVTWRFAPRQPLDKWTVVGPGEWRIRFTPMEAGEHIIRVFVKDAVRTAESGPRKFIVADAPTDGFIRVSREDRRYLAFDSGRPYFANGFNIISSNTAKYDYFFDNMAKHGCNFARIWMTPFSDGLESKTLGRYEQDAAAAIDQMLDSAQRHGIYIMMCILDYREASTRDAWDKNVYNAARGGPCQSAAEFFSNPIAKEYFKKRLRYILARWSAYTSVHSWEFWNEVDITDGWRESPYAVRAWHREMSWYLRQNDPHEHLITSSFAGVYDGDILWESRRMDIVQTHRYIGNKLEDFGDIFVGFTRTFARYRKPYHIGEFGLFNPGQRAVDAEGISLHNGLWSATVNGACAAPMSWWWEWIDTNNLWPHFAALARFVQGIHWPTERFAPLKNANLTFREGPPTVEQSALLQPVFGSFRQARYNRENEFIVDAQGNVDRPHLLAKYLHGLGNHPDLHNPQIFKLTYPHDGEFAVGIDGVSGYGGARLKIWLDSTVALEKDMPDDDPSEKTIHKFDGEYVIKVPKGYHTIKVENLGKDWFVVTHYRLFNIKVPVDVQLQGLQGERTTLAWVWNTSNVWYAKLLGRKPVVAEGVEVKFWDLRPGEYRITVFDTYSGEDILSQKRDIYGEIRLRLPAIEKDIAIKLERMWAK